MLIVTDLVWPDRLPYPSVSGYGAEPMDPTLRTDMESGPARQRRRYTDAPVRYTVQWRMTAEQYALYEAWLQHKAAYGAAWVRMPVLGGLGLDKPEARFVGPGKATWTGQRWSVSATLEVRQRPLLSEDALDLLLVEDLPGLTASADALRRLVHVDLPLLTEV